MRNGLYRWGVDYAGVLGNGNAFAAFASKSDAEEFAQWATEKAADSDITFYVEEIEN